MHWTRICSGNLVAQGQNVRNGNDTHGALAVYGCATADLTQVAESVCSAFTFG